ncbi:hypothetical protein SAMN05444166_6288 [Singulisphaera sp. GP187]|uniref:hypothetical protein n=1 Tax=Singulisphaera sp. GP187 TaxID=1882752 RepID=UPI0009287DC1|nr:hypothetical protein [Singulisphaera sp. GP187]SIO60157.1 hypothetical protein SAMN05444166_6288 [Singulisphaera sp. GP187]
MRQIRMKRAALIGDNWQEEGSVVEIHDDFRAAKLVELGHAEYVAMVAVPVPQRAVAPPASERATASNAKGK